MSQLNTVAVLDDKELEAEIRLSFPGIRVIGSTVVAKVRSLIKQGSVGLFATGVKQARPAEVQMLRSIARDAAKHDIPALFVAHSADDYSLLKEVMASAPIIGVAFGRKEVRPMVNLLRDRAARVHLSKHPMAMPAAVSDLDDHPLIAETTSFLRNPGSGRLDVKRIAEFYGEPLNKFATALGVSPSAVSQTPDSKKYQNFLGYFEKVARIVPLLENKSSFSTWVKSPNKELKGAAPLELLWGGPAKARKLVDVVEDVLVGQPD